MHVHSPDLLATTSSGQHAQSLYVCGMFVFLRLNKQSSDLGVPSAGSCCRWNAATTFEPCTE